MARQITHRILLDDRLQWWDSPYFQKALAVIIRKSLWQFGESAEADDLKQEAYCVFLRVLQKYPAAKDRPHVMRLFQTSVKRRFLNINGKQIIPLPKLPTCHDLVSLWDLRSPRHYMRVEHLLLDLPVSEGGRQPLQERLDQFQGVLGDGTEWDGGQALMELVGTLAQAPTAVRKLLYNLLHQPSSAWDRQDHKVFRKLPIRETTESWRARLGNTKSSETWAVLYSILKGKCT